MWAYKYDNRKEKSTGIDLHADEGRVNVNMWLTEDDANIDPEGGGLIVYDLVAPSAWSFQELNRDQKKIEGILKKHGSKSTYIRHKTNRMVVFNSMLFHGSGAYHFKPGYKNRRVNITFLFGVRSFTDANEAASNRPWAPQGPGGVPPGHEPAARPGFPAGARKPANRHQ